MPNYVIMRVVRGTPRNIRNRIYKLLLGTTVTIGNKRYRTAGLIRKVNGEVISSGLYIVPSEKLIDVIEKLKEKQLDDYIEILRICLCTCGSQ